MKIKNNILLIIIVLSSFLGMAQVNFSLQGPTSVSQGANFTIVFTLQADGNGSNFVPPAFNNFSVLSGPSTSTQTSIQMSGSGVVKSTVSSYGYTLRANSTGNFTIGAASISVGGKTYKSNTLNINVTAGQPQQGGQNPTTQGGGQSGASQQQEGQAVRTDSKDIFIKTTVSQRNPYQGEQVIVTYKFYTRVGITSIQRRTGSTYPGFWMQDLDDPNQKSPQRDEIINGVRYLTAEIKKVALFPVRAGELTIEPLILDVGAQYTKSRQGTTGDPFFDQFFNSMFQTVDNVKLVVQSEATKINVKPYPEAGKPASFKGATGNYTFQPEVSTTKIKTNEAMTLKFTIAGTGNIELVELPEIKFPVDFEVYDPKITHNVKRNASGVSGWKTFEYLIIPRAAGNFTIPAVPFSYFDPAQGKYTTHTSPPYTIQVEKGDGSAHDVSYTTIHQEDIKYIGNDVRYMKMPPYTLQKAGYSFYKSWKFSTVIVVLFAIFFVTTIAMAKARKQRRNEMLMRNRKATKVARKRLKKGYVFMKNNQPNEFFEENTNALWGYLSDKFSIPRATLSRETATERLSEKGVGEETIKEIVGIIDDCEFARYAPAQDKHDNMESIYRNSISIISKIEQNLR
ncbi:MAG: BatD family protein [Bacteroidales bacterium]|nr:BatD family protein [Bacteroidales bacterium]